MERLKNPQDFSLVYSRGKPSFGRFIVVSALPTDHKVSRVGFAVSKKMGNAVTRNRIKRKLRAIMYELSPRVVPGFDLIIGAKRSCAKASFADLQRDLAQVMQGSGFLARINDGEENDW